jgi:filamentous hemagglutinin family protein
MHGKICRVNKNIDFYMQTLSLLGCVLVAISIDFFANRANAQIKPDETLGNENSEFKNSQVLGGAGRGDNLFHSFKEFNIGATQRVDFSNPVEVKNIIARVTGTEASKIDGILGVKGAANLFFLNPNGISFSDGAKLEMSGNFVGSTASSLKFADGTIFDAKMTGAPLLTMSIPIGLQFGRNLASITLKNSGNLTLTNPGNLERSYNGSSLLLVGGNIELDKSKIFLRGGKIELVAIGENGSATIDYGKLTNSQALSVTVPAKQVMADINLRNGSSLITSDTVSGNIGLSARNVRICGALCSATDPDETFSTIEAELTGSSTVAAAKGGEIRIEATDEVLVDGTRVVKNEMGNNVREASRISTSLKDSSNINGGSIVVNSRNLKILNGASISTTTNKNSSGNGGDINLNIKDTLELAAPRNGQENEIASGAGGTGESGNNITIYTGRLSHKDGAQIYTDNSDGRNINVRSGKLGDIKIVAAELVEIAGVSSKNFLFGFAKPTGITSFTGGNKNAGNIQIQTPYFFLRDGASISAGTDEKEFGGTISVTGIDGKNSVLVELVGNSGIDRSFGINNVSEFTGIGNGSRIRTVTSTDGKAGRVIIQADRVSLKSGTRIDVSTLNGNNNGGSINIHAQTLDLSDGGQLISTTRGGGQAGNINVNADRVLLSGTDKVFNEKRAFFDFINTINSQGGACDFLQRKIRIEKQQ